ncbi:hypothetical protein BCR34DRAFT_558196 [Clohesyomyces aquaticus]|uniref:Uncharacterized protein n=1 Tax=Clohesyomyces aquaticus TaxID=1231657 RepID=A0A1Y2A014_9PLEO|nr:hypothetical protein BCR34DRAFT_558196 [Clohesyomyces aquaticus]
MNRLSQTSLSAMTQEDRLKPCREARNLSQRPVSCLHSGTPWARLYDAPTSDVFMDSVNREISVKMICEAARRSVGRQYILITPQAMSSVVHDDDVTVIRSVTAPFANF